MKEQYEIHNKLLKSLIFDNLKVIGLLIIGFPFYYKWRNGTEFVFEEFWIWFFLGFTFVTNIPAIIIYLNYYLENKNTKFTIDYKDEKLSITQNGISKEYEFSQIEQSTYNLSIYYKNAVDKAMRIPMLISDFGYWDLVFKNGDRYFLTNLLHDFLLDEPKVKNTIYRFRIFPTISKAKPIIDIQNHSKTVKYYDTEIKYIENQFIVDTEISLDSKKIDKLLLKSFESRYKKKSDYELKDIVKNQSRYQKEAVLAAQNTLSKTLGNNS